MRDNQDIHQFSVKWRALFSDPEHLPRAIFNDYEPLGAEMAALGFHMDCGTAIEAAYPGLNWSALNVWRQLLPKLTDTSLLTSALFSQWRYWNHWSVSPLTESDYQWFLLTFSRLMELTE